MIWIMENVLLRPYPRSKEWNEQHVTNMHGARVRTDQTSAEVSPSPLSRVRSVFSMKCPWEMSRPLSVNWRRFSETFSEKFRSSQTLLQCTSDPATSTPKRRCTYCFQATKERKASFFATTETYHYMLPCRPPNSLVNKTEHRRRERGSCGYGISIWGSHCNQWGLKINNNLYFIMKYDSNNNKALHCTVRRREKIN